MINGEKELSVAVQGFGFEEKVRARYEEKAKASLITDLTDTAIRQLPDLAAAFPPPRRLGVRSLLARGWHLFVLTGDRSSTAKKYFADPLRPLPGAGRLAIASEAGYSLDLVSNATGEFVEVDRGPELPDVAQHELPGIVEEVLQRVSGTAFEFTPGERAAFQSRSGGRFDITKRLSGLATTLAEGSRAKQTIFFPNEFGDREAEVLRQLKEHPRVRKFAEAYGLHTPVGKYIDITTVQKSDGVEMLYRNGLVDSSRRVIVIGDSANDLPMFEFPFPGPTVLRIYLGSDASIAQHLADCHGPQFFWLKSQFTAGFDCLLRELLAD